MYHSDKPLTMFIILSWIIISDYHSLNWFLERLDNVDVAMALASRKSQNEAYCVNWIISVYQEMYQRKHLIANGFAKVGLTIDNYLLIKCCLCNTYFKLNHKAPNVFSAGYVYKYLVLYLLPCKFLLCIYVFINKYVIR